MFIGLYLSTLKSDEMLTVSTGVQGLLRSEIGGNNRVFGVLGVEKWVLGGSRAMKLEVCWV